MSRPVVGSTVGGRVPGARGGRRAACRSPRVVFREGHDAVGASVVLRDADRPQEGRRVRMTPGAPGTDRWHADVVLDRPGAVDVRGRGVERPAGHLAPRGHRQDRGRPGQPRTSPTTSRPAPGCSTSWPARCPSAERPARRGRRRRAARHRPRRRAPGRAGARRRTCRRWSHEHPVRECVTALARATRCGSTGRARCTAPGTSSSRARSAPSWPATRSPRPSRPGTARSRTPPSTSTTSPRWASTSSTCRRSTRSARSTARARTTPSSPPSWDVGSPWAIGSRDGGHDAIHPELGHDGRLHARSSRAPSELGMEVALDLALQCAPDHPWVTAHPEWFTTKPDGTIAYAENPPKKYQDIYPLNFDNDPQGPLRRVPARRAALDRRRRARSSASTTRTPSR